MTVAARIVECNFMAAVGTNMDMPSQIGGSALHDIGSHFIMLRMKLVALLIIIDMTAKNVGNFHSFSLRRSERSA